MDGAARSNGDRSERVARARLSGRCTFLGIDLEIGPRTAVPVPETEVLARAVIGWLGAPYAPSDPWALDVRCGSGHLACALAIAVPGVRVWACDREDDALRSAERNVHAHGLSHRVDIRRGDLVTAVDGLHLEGRLDAIVCSPPDAVDDGEWRAFHAPLLEQAAELLRLGGRAYVEVDPGRPDRLRALARSHASYEWIDFARDETGRPCAAILRRVAARQGPRIPRRDRCAFRSETGFATTSSAAIAPSY